MSRLNLVAKHLWGRRFAKAEDGAVTVEGVLWVPVFFALLALIVDTSMLFTSQDRMLRAVHDANRAYATGRLASIDAASSFIRDSLGGIGENASVSGSVVDGLVRLQVSIPAVSVTPIGLVRVFASENLTVDSTFILDL